MANPYENPSDLSRTRQPRAGVAMADGRGIPGYLLVGAAVLALTICLASAAMGYQGWTIATGVIAILAAAAGSVWVYLERRRVARLAQQSLADSTRQRHNVG
jgi:hypothetical protein